MNPLAGLEATVGSDLLKKIQTSKILLVGYVTGRVPMFVAFPSNSHFLFFVYYFPF
jgi:hypothetical protein